MSTEIKREISCFTADYFDGKVSIGGKSFPSGYFFMNALNEYRKPYNGDDDEDFEIAQRIMVVKGSRDRVLDELTFGFLNQDNAEKLYDEIQYYLRVIARAKPFCLLDFDAERERCQRIFCEDNVAHIISYLYERSISNHKKNHDWVYSSGLPRKEDVEHFQAEENRLQEFIGAIKFYDEMGEGMNYAYEIGSHFVRILEAPTKRSKSNLMEMALNCIAQTRSDFMKNMQLKVEYVTVPKGKKQNVFDVGRRITFERFGDFLMTDFFEGIQAGHYPLQCGVCKQYFLQTTAHRPKYCSGFAPNDPKGRSCVAYAARDNRLENKRLEKERVGDYWVHGIYNTRRSTINKHLQRGKITEEQARKAKRYIEDLLYQAKSANKNNKNFLEHYEDYMKQNVVYEAVGIEL